MAEPNRRESFLRRVPETVRFALAALLVALAIHGPHLGGGWVWDDVYLVRDNPSLRTVSGLSGILARDLWGGATGRPTSLYHPLPMLTFWLQARVGAIAVAPMRALNVLLHVACSIALFAFLRRRNLRAEPAWIAAGLLLVHPSSTEPVQWLTGRHDTLGALCVLGALLCVQTPVMHRARGWIAAALLCALGFLSKEPYVIAPVLLLSSRLLEVPPAPRESPWLRALPFGVVAGVFGLRALLGIQSGSAQLGAPLGDHARNEASILAHYFLQIVRGDNGPTVATYSPLSGLASAAVLAGVALVSMALVVLAWRRGATSQVRGVLLGWWWFVLALAPHLIALPVIGQWGNRYGYFPAAGLAVALAYGLDALWVPLARQGRRAVMAVTLGSAALVALLAVDTSQEAAAWHDDLELYARDVARDPSDGRARYHYAVALQRRRGCGEALPEFARATHDAPEYPRGWHNLAGCLINLGRFADAVEPARQDVARSPENSRAYYNLGVALVMSGSREAGIAALERALALEPGLAPARAMLDDARRGAHPPG